MKIWNYFFFFFLKTVFAVWSLIVLLFFIITYIDNSLYYFNKHPTTLINTFLYYFWQVPDIGLKILPFAVLISGVISHWTFARVGEISALRSAGMSVWRITFPFVCGSIFYVFVHMCIAEFALPIAYQKYETIKNNVIENKKVDDIFEKTTWFRSKRGFLHFEEYDPVTKTLINPEFFEYNKTNTELKNIVHSANAFFDPEKKVWIFTDPPFETDVYFAPPKVLKENVSSSELSYSELSHLIDSARRAHINVTGRLVDLYQRVSLPFSNLIFLLFTVPFVFQNERREKSYLSVLFCVSLSILYWFGNVFFKNIAVHGIINPLLSAWVLNIVFGMFALIMISKLEEPK